MPLVLPRSVMLMIPRTASTWCRQAIRNAGIKFRDLNPKHAPMVPSQNPPLQNVPSFQFTFKREPGAWLKSRWTLGAWEDELTPFWNIDFATFRAAVSDPMVEMYFAKYASRCQYVGFGENIADELVAALRQAGEEFDETSLRDTPKVNASNGELMTDAYWKMSRDTLNAMPAEHIARFPVELLPKLTEKTLANLPPLVLAKLVPQLAKAAMQAAGAGLSR